MATASSTLLLGAALFLLLLGLLPSPTLAVWPEPQYSSLGTQSMTLAPKQFTVTTSSSSSLLQKAIGRYSALFFPFSSVTSGNSFTLSIQVHNDSEDLQLGVSEAYNITTNTAGSGLMSADTVFGAMRGLETFSQLITYQPDSGSYVLPYLPTTIRDWPRFPWRGLLLDSSRHYLTVDAIKRSIDAMSYAKYNTFHWHAVDAESFPVESQAYPMLTKAAYGPDAVYTHADIKDIVQYALERGIRVLPEFDIPGHSASWGVGYPGITAKCPRYSANVNNIALDISNNATYKLLHGFLTEMAGLFPEQFLHLGGDEVVFQCWFDDPKIAAWAAAHGYSSGAQLEQYFEGLLQEMVIPASGTINKKMVVWQELFQNGINLDKKNVVVQVWISQALLASVVQAGYHGLLSAGYYLDKQIPNPSQTWYEWVDTWKNFYTNDPTGGLSLTKEQEGLVLGGEAAMWGEQVDETNIESRVWPRAAATAERLWSDKSVNDVEAALPRLVNFRCNSLARRGIHAGPVAPDYCPLPRSATTRH